MKAFRAYALVLALVLPAGVGAELPFAIQSIEPTNGGYNISWMAQSGMVNQVMYTDGLDQPWQSLPSAQYATNRFVLSYTDTTSTDATQRFYHVRAFRNKIVMSLVLDRSGSMLANAGAAVLPGAVSNFIDLFNENDDRAAMASFATCGSIDVTMRQPFKTAIKAAANGLSFNGFTCAEAGLSNGLAQNDTAIVLPGENVVKVIVFFSDGMANAFNYTLNCGPRIINYNRDVYNPSNCTPTGGCTVPSSLSSISGGTVNPLSCAAMHDEAESRALAIANLARSKGNYIYAIGMGDPSQPGECAGISPVLNPEFLKKLANTTNSATYNPSQPSGDYVIAANAAALQQVFQQIASKVLSQSP